MGFDHPQWEMYTSARHGVIRGIEGHEEGKRAPTCQNCHLMEGNHAVHTPWGFLGLRIPTKENVLALIEVAPALEPQLTKLAADHEFAKAIAVVQGLYLIMLEYRQRTFQGAFHASNDHMHWYGWAPLKTAVNTILEEEQRMRAEHAAAANKN